MKKDIEKALMEFLMDVRTTGEERNPAHHICI